MHYRRFENGISGRILAVHADIPAPIRDLLAVLDLWCDLSATFAGHVRDAVHSHRSGRYAVELTLPDGSQFVLGPLCDECVELVADRAAEWTATYPLTGAEALPWSDVSSYRNGRWVAV